MPANNKMPLCPPLLQSSSCFGDDRTNADRIRRSEPHRSRKGALVSEKKKLALITRELMVRAPDARSFPARAPTSCATSSGMRFSTRSSRSYSTRQASRLPPSTNPSANECDTIGAAAVERARGSVGGNRWRAAPLVAALTLGGTARLGHPSIGSVRGRARLSAQRGEYVLLPRSRYASHHRAGNVAELGAALLLARLYRRVLRRTGRHAGLD